MAMTSHNATLVPGADNSIGYQSGIDRLISSDADVMCRGVKRTAIKGREDGVEAGSGRGEKFA